MHLLERVFKMSDSRVFLYGAIALTVLVIGVFAFSSPAKTTAAPIGNPTAAPGGATAVPSGQEQAVSIRALSTGFYDKREVTVKAGVPVKLEFSAEPGAGCGRQFLIPDFGVRLVSQAGEKVFATFVPTAGRHAYQCGMAMFRGVLNAQ